MHRARERAAVTDVDIPALLARDKLLQEADPDTCCGEGTITLDRVRWAELDGQDPSELILELQEYIGEGCADTHIRVYQVRDPTNPVLLGPPLRTGGYAIFPYMDLVDLDADGVQELALVGPSGGSAPATFEVFEVKGAALKKRHAPDLEIGIVYLPFDHDGDGRIEIAALHSDDPSDPKAGAMAKLLSSVDGTELEVDPKAWLPKLYTAALTHPKLERADEALPLLLALRDKHGFVPSHPEALADAVLTRLHDAEYTRAYYVQALGGRWSDAQAKKAHQMLGLPKIGLYAGRAILRSQPTPKERETVFAALLEALRLHANDPKYEWTFPFRDGDLTPAEHARLCARVTQIIETGEGIADRRGDLAWGMLRGQLPCHETTRAIFARAADVSPRVLRGAIHAASEIDYATDKPKFPGVASLREPMLKVLANPDLAFAHAEVARALALVPNTLQPLRAKLAKAKDAELQRSLLVALRDLPSAGDPALFLNVLPSAGSSRVRHMLHSEIARSQDLGAIRQGLSLVADKNDYEAYQWWVVYRTKKLRAEVRAVLAKDAAGRLGDKDARIRQYACQILAKSPWPAARARVESTSTSDAVDYVRSACADALKAAATPRRAPAP